eukprot:2045999-Rhodomonas_salina.1
MRPEFILAVRLISLAKAGYSPSLDQLKEAQFDLPMPTFEAQSQDSVDSAGPAICHAGELMENERNEGETVDDTQTQAAADPLVTSEEDTIKPESAAEETERSGNHEKSKTEANEADVSVETDDTERRYAEEENARAEAAAAAARERKENERIKAEEESKRKIEEERLNAEAAEKEAEDENRNKEKANQAIERNLQTESFVLPNAVDDGEPPRKAETQSTVTVPKKTMTEKVGDGVATAFKLSEAGMEVFHVQENAILHVQETLENQTDGDLVQGAWEGMLSKQEVANFVEAGISAVESMLGISQALLPMLSPVIGLVKCFVSLVDKKNKNDMKIRRMVPRINNIISLIKDALTSTEKQADALMPHINAVQTTLKNIVEFFEKFFKKGYFSKLYQTAIKPTILDDLDKELTDNFLSFAAAASVKALKMSKPNEENVRMCQEHFLEIQAFQRAMTASSVQEEVAITQCNPAQLAKFATMCGRTEKETLAELQTIRKENNLQQEYVLNAMNGFHQKIDDLCERFHSVKDEVRRENEHLVQRMRKDMQKIYDKAEKTQLAVFAVETKVDALTVKLDNGLHNVTKMVEQLLSKPQQSMNSSATDLAFSSKKVSGKLGQVAADFMAHNFVPTDSVIHSCGVGGKLPYLDGMNGAMGISGEMHRVAGSLGADGKDGMVGELGSPGLDCIDFKIGILVHTIEGRKFAYISHSGQKGKTSRLEITEDVFIFVQGRGGNGGAGGTGGDG